MGYLESEAGHRFVESVRLEEPKSPYGRILGAVQVGLVLLADDLVQEAFLRYLRSDGCSGCSSSPGVQVEDPGGSPWARW